MRRHHGVVTKEASDHSWPAKVLILNRGKILPKSRDRETIKAEILTNVKSLRRRVQSCWEKERISSCYRGLEVNRESVAAVEIDSTRGSSDLR